MRPLAYTVVATIPDRETLTRYIHWLVDGHIQAVIAGGASIAEVLGPDPTDPTYPTDPTDPTDPTPSTGPFRVETRYTFPTPDAFRTYEARHAPALRADGTARFGGVAGMTFTRHTAAVLGRAAAGSGTTT
jgi:hypothetical protein